MLNFNLNKVVFLTAEDMLKMQKTQDYLKEVGNKSDIKKHVEQYHSKTKNYKKGVYYKVKTDCGYAGMGKGLYLGRDRKALINFYDVYKKGLPITIYVGFPKWLDLLNYERKDAFMEDLKKHGINTINSDKVKNIVKKMGYDGIRYYDPFATGEEFVLFNLETVKKS